jgi:alkyldihydroxyacetonephosphate synthase
VQKPPRFRANASCKFTDFNAAVAATRALAQSGLYPSNCRLLDATEAMVNQVSTDFTHVLLIAFESADHELKPWMDRALAIVAEHGGKVATGPTFREAGERASSEGESGEWREAFFRAPYRQSAMVSLGMIADTFETAITWDRFESLHKTVCKAVNEAMQRECGGGILSCRFTHVYPDGPAPYYTFIAPGKEGLLLEQWLAIKQAAGDALMREGATITHHHAVGKLHRPWYETQRPHLFGEVLGAIKKTLDPQSILNPNVLIQKEQSQ